MMSADGVGALIVIERETGLEEVAETGVMVHGDLSADLLQTIFMPRTALHDGAVIIRDDAILAAGALLPLAETTIHTERFGTRHRAALGITEQTDAVVVVVSEENSQISLVERARIVRNLNEAQLAAARPPSSTRRGESRRRRLASPPARRPRRTAPRSATSGAMMRRAERTSRRRARARRGSRPDGGRTGTAVTRVLGFIVHNWPLKLAALVLATLLYAGLVLSRERPDLARPASRSSALNQPHDTFILGDLPPVHEVRYFPVDARALSSTFTATVDLPASCRGPGLVTVPVRLQSIDAGSRPRLHPRRRHDPARRSSDRTVPVTVSHGPVPDGLRSARPRSRRTVVASGPASVVATSSPPQALVRSSSRRARRRSVARSRPSMAGRRGGPVKVEPDIARVRILVFPTAARRPCGRPCRDGRRRQPASRSRPSPSIR